MSEYDKQIGTIIAKVRVLLCGGNIEQAQDLLDEAARLVLDKDWPTPVPVVWGEDGIE
jgi:hypothetical protein